MADKQEQTRQRWHKFMSASEFDGFKFISFTSPHHPTRPRLYPSLKMRSVALSAGLLALALVVAAEEQKPIFKVMTFYYDVVHRSLSLIHAPRSLPLSKLPSSSSSPATGCRAGHPQRPPKRPPLVLRHLVMSVNGRSRSPPLQSSKAIRVWSPRARLPITPSLPL